MTPREQAKIRILIADDHQIFREGLAAILNRQPDMIVVAESANGKEALQVVAEHRPDVVLLDLRMPIMDGLTTIAEFRKQEVNAAIVVLTTFDSEEDVYQGLRLGARAYLLKDVPRSELLDCIRTVHAGGTYFPLGIASKLARRMSDMELTGRELEVLRLMVKGKTNREIGDELSVTEGTTKLHVNSILQKLGAKGRTEAVTMAIKRGLVRI